MPTSIDLQVENEGMPTCSIPCIAVILLRHFISLLFNLHPSIAPYIPPSVPPPPSLPTFHAFFSFASLYLFEVKD